MEKDFDRWNKIKKDLEYKTLSSDMTNFPKVGEVWMINLGLNIGYQQNGSSADFSRPVLVIKKFNSQMFWSVPLSTKQKTIDFYYNFTDINNQKVSAILSQIRLTSVKRFKRKLYDMNHDLFQDIRMRLRSFI